jgi:5'-deoxynucleotidase YfbR-like HD superfamily hydrolase
LITPFKAAVGLDYRDFEARLQRAVHIRFGLPPEMPKALKQLVKRADRISAYLEAVHLAGFSIEEAERLFGKPREAQIDTLDPWPPPEAKARFLSRFERLYG